MNPSEPVASTCSTRRQLTSHMIGKLVPSYQQATTSKQTGNTFTSKQSPQNHVPHRQLAPQHRPSTSGNASSERKTPRPGPGASPGKVQNLRRAGVPFKRFPSFFSSFECTGFKYTSEDSSEVTFLLVENYQLTTPVGLRIGREFLNKTTTLE